MALTLSEIANVASGLFMVALGGFVFSVRPRRPGNVAFVLFSVGFGVGIAASNLLRVEPALLVLLNRVTIVSYLVALAGVFAMMVTFPAPLQRGQRRVGVAGILVASAGFAALIAFGIVPEVLSGRSALPGRSAFEEGLYVATISTMPFALAAYLFILVGLVTRLPRDTSGLRRQYVLLSAALLLYVGYVAGGGVNVSSPVFPLTPYTTWTTGPLLATMLLLATLWLAESTRGPDPRTSRNVALFALALPLLGLSLSATQGAFEVRGVLRTLCVAVLAYAILRHQLLGLDLRVRWGISRGTVAAVFVGLFFVGTQIAQNLFNSQYGPLWGGITAGVMLFAISPLQRAADHVAHRAVPEAGPRPAREPAIAATSATPPAIATGNDAAFRAAVRLALRDRRFSHEEELALADLAERLGIGARRATEIRHEVEREMGVA